MAVTRGCKGVIKAKDNAATGAAGTVLECKNWNYEESAEQIDASSMGDCTKKYVAGAQETTGTIEAHWDPSATGNQGVFTVGAVVDLELYPGGTATGVGTVYYKTPAAGATITSVNRSGGVDSIVANSFGFTVNGAMTATTIP